MTSAMRDAKASLRDFSSDDFDRVRWINEQTRARIGDAGGSGRDATARDGSAVVARAVGEGTRGTSASPLERFLADLELQLQLLGEDLSMSLEERSREGVARVPKAVKEIEVVEGRVKRLHEEVRGILDRLDEVESESRASVEALRQLDAAKQRMESARETLQEANGLADLMASVDGIFASGNIRNMSESLARMKRGLAVVGDVPEFADGQDKVNAFEHKLEAIVRPALITALESQNSTAAREHRDVLRTTGRGSALESIYADTRVTSRMLKQWKSRERDATTTDAGRLDASVHMIDEFLKYCATALKEEISWCSSTFPEDAVLLIPLSWCSLHTTLETSITEKLSSLTLEQLVSARNSFQTYVEDVGIAFTKLAGDAAAHANADAVKGAIGDALMAIVEPFIAVEQRFGQLALADIRTTLDSSVNIPEAQSIATSDDLTAVIQSVLATLPKAIDVFGVVVDRCEAITAGVETMTCIHAIESGMEHYVDLVALVLRDLRNAAGLIDSTATNMNSNTTSAGEEFIRGSLSMLDMINAIPNAVLDFESDLRAKLLKLRATLRPALDVTLELGDGPKSRTLLGLSIAAHAARSRKLATFLDKVADAAVKHSLDGSIIPVGAEHMNALTRSLEKFVYDTLLGRVSLELKGISTSEVWSAKPAESAYKLPTFSAYPQERMTNAGEYLLSLPQHLDNMHDDDLARATLLSGDSNAAQEPATSEAWIAKIAEASAELLLKEVRAIASLTDQGAAQLSADLEYFSNIVAALSLAPPSALIAWYKCASAPRDEYEDFARAATSEGIDVRVVRAAAATRGIKLSSSL